MKHGELRLKPALFFFIQCALLVQLGFSLCTFATFSLNSNLGALLLALFDSLQIFTGSLVCAVIKFISTRLRLELSHGRIVYEEAVRV